MVSLAIAAVSAFLVLRFAPFPFWIRLLIIFGALLGYEYSVIARNYGLGVLLMLAACIAFPRRHERPIPLAVALGMLANTSVHAAFASQILTLVWLMDVFTPASRGSLARPDSIAAFGIVAAAIALALMSAHPSPDMAFGFSPGQVEPGKVLRVLLADPGWSLMGVMKASLTGAGELPWARIGLDWEMMARLIADTAIASVAWALRKNRRCLTALVLAIFGFEVLFRFVYSGSARHEGILAFLMISLCWVACTEPKTADMPGRRRAIALGLLPLLVPQTLALPIIARRDFMHPESASKAFGALIRQNPRYRDAIVMAEPDFMMEPMPYYASNPVFMPRQGEFHYRVYFDRGARRKLDLHLESLVDVADSLSCTSGQPVLLAIAYEKLLTDTAGEAHPAYQGTLFRWNSAERTRLFARSKLVSSFTGATTDENYSVFEIAPARDSTCLGRGHE